MLEIFEELNKADMKDSIIEFVKQYFGTVDKPYNGPTYILSDGTMLNLSNCKHHSEVEKVLIENGYSSYSYIPTGGSPTMRYLGAIRCDTIKYYIDLPEQSITRAQMNTLLIWLDFLYNQCKFISVYANEGRIYCDYDFKEYIPDDIINKIKRYYIFGRLYESKETETNSRRYKREPIGNELDDFD